jgi:Gly-Xaa carboxypeptidase
VAELQEYLAHVFSPVAAKYNVSLEMFGKDIQLKGCPKHMTEAKAGKVVVSESLHSS